MELRPGLHERQVSVSTRSDVTSGHGSARGRYVNEDLAVVPESQRTWKSIHFIVLWVALSLNITNYLLVTSFLEGGFSYVGACGVVLLGSLAITPALVLNGHAGAKYGIPFPVLARASFGMKGANVAAVMRGLVACGWFGVQCWIGGQALWGLVRLWAPNLSQSQGPVLMFTVFWALNIGLALTGMQGLRHLLLIKSVLLLVVVCCLLGWALWITRGSSIHLSTTTNRAVSVDSVGASVTSVVGTWATLALNIPDFTRYAQGHGAQAWGQALGLPLAMLGFTVVTLATTAATTKLYGVPIYDPLQLVTRLHSTTLQALGYVMIALATLATNLAANMVSPANDWANLLPQYITYRGGALITGVVSLGFCPWLLLSSPHVYIYDWLVAYASLLGPLLGILLWDYFVLRGRELDMTDLYSDSCKGRYYYRNGYNPAAFGALLLGLLPNVPGFLGSVRVLQASDWLVSLYSYSWFMGLAVSALAYPLLMAWQGHTGAGAGAHTTPKDDARKQEEDEEEEGQWRRARPTFKRHGKLLEEASVLQQPGRTGSNRAQAPQWVGMQSFEAAFKGGEGREEAAGWTAKASSGKSGTEGHVGVVS